MSVSTAEQGARLERRSLQLRILSIPALIVPYSAVMMVWGGARLFDVAVSLGFVYLLIAAQLVAWRWRLRAEGQDTGDNRYWYGLSVVFLVGVLAISVWWFFIERQ